MTVKKIAQFTILCFVWQAKKYFGISSLYVTEDSVCKAIDTSGTAEDSHGSFVRIELFMVAAFGLFQSIF